jgi:autotransporter passenger strand-loop-strand repeat protein
MEAGRTNFTTLSGGSESVFDAGTADHTTVNSGGILTVHVGGTSDLATINGNGVVNVLGGAAIHTTINEGGSLNVDSAGVATLTTINQGGIENILAGGKSITTTILSGGHQEVFEGGISDATTIQAGGIEKVAGTANNTSIFPGGELIILSGGTANNVAFIDNGAQHNATLTLYLPTGLTGTITGWHVGDVIDFVNTTVTNVSVENNILTLTYGEGLRGPESAQVSYQLASLQSNTHFELQSDGEGGTELTLQPGVQSEASLVDVPLIGMSVEGPIAALSSDARG